MAFNKKVARGSLGIARRTTEGGPGYVGSLVFEDDVRAGEKVWLAGWIKEGDNGKKFFSLAAERPRTQERQVERRPEADFGAAPPARPIHRDMDDEIPF